MRLTLNRLLSNVSSLTGRLRRWRLIRSSILVQRRVPLDKEKGLVKDKNILSGAEHRLLLTLERGLEPKLWDIAAASLTG